MARKSRRKGAARPQFKLTSPDIRPNGPIALEQVLDGFGCSGQNISPALKWSGAPADTKSFALLVHDPDAPTGGAGWWHWVVINIPAEATELKKGAGKTDGATLPAGGASLTTSAARLRHENGALHQQHGHQADSGSLHSHPLPSAIRARLGSGCAKSGASSHSDWRHCVRREARFTTRNCQ